MRIERANSKAIRYACTHFHYSKSTPQAQFGYNVYNDNDEWCGVIVYGGGATRGMSTQFGKNPGEVLELERVALNGKQGSTSQAVALSLRQLKKDNPIIQMVVSYADHRQKHLGTIYQASNWIYLGIAEVSSSHDFFYKGKWTHERSINAAFPPGKKREQAKKRLPKRACSDKFKYVYCFNRRDKKKFSKMALPYPTNDDIHECEMQVEKRKLSNDDNSSV